MQNDDHGASGGHGHRASTDWPGTKTTRPDTPVAPTYRDLRGLLGPAKLFVYLTLAMAAVAFVSNILELRLLGKFESGGFATEAEIFAAADANDQRQMVILLVYLAVNILSYIFVGRWIFFASKNLRALGAMGLQFSPGWAVGWYFIPIANLWKPYQAMKEIWQASSQPLHWHSEPVSGLMPAWWALWILTSVADRVVSRMATDAETIPALMGYAKANIALSALAAVLCAVFAALISEITRRQVEAIELKTAIAVF